MLAIESSKISSEFRVMPLPETVVFDVPNLLTLAGVSVSILAALYSARSARASMRQANAAEAALKQATEQLQLTRATLAESKRQNRIASHGMQLEAFKALLSFSSQASANGIDFKREAVWALWEHARIAEFYFSASLVKKLTSIVDTALALQSVRDEWKLDDTYPASQRKDALEKTYVLLKQLRVELESAEQLMRKELRLVRENA